MTDEATRKAEREWKASGDAAAGQAWVEGELRATGAPLLPMIGLLIQTTRALRLLLDGAAVTHTHAAREALRQRVTPEIMVSFLRGTDEWSRPLGMTAWASPPGAGCAYPPCANVIPSGLPVSATYCSLRCAEEHRDAIQARQATRLCANEGCPVPAGGAAYCSDACARDDAS